MLSINARSVSEWGRQGSASFEATGGSAPPLPLNLSQGRGSAPQLCQVPASARVREGEMDQFVSTFTNKIDTKGRVSVPAPFRTVLAKDGLDQAFLLSVARCACARCRRPAPRGRDFDRLVEDLAPYSDERDHLATALFGTSEILTIDQDGRTVLPRRLRDHAASPRITFVGLGEKFQMWEPKRFNLICRRHARKCATSARYSARGVAEAAGQREHGNDGGQRQVDCRRRTGPPSSRDALGGNPGG